ncbi:MAG: lipase family protein [Bacteroidia bacterium]|jgi:triacylglycerol lipase|nr:lipase family protein [Bacteroidota bacterium]MBP9689325.1 lipase family protein [Bacteroidia bacterium]
MNRILNIPESEQNTVLLLAQVSANAYPVKPFPNMDPPATINGYTFAKWILGEDFRKEKSIEKYVAIYQEDNKPNYIFAFRGTWSLDDIKIDLEFWKQKPFPYYYQSGVTANIAYGFHDVYTNDVLLNRQNGSLQQALFEFLQANTVENLMITGHSLGAALAEIFTIDLSNAIASNSLKKIELTHYNFACPRVGDFDLQQAYQIYCISTNLCQVFRLVNYYDFVPCLPFFDLGYVHVSDYYLFSFWVNDDFRCDPLTELDRHSIINYHAVLTEILNDKKKEGTCLDMTLRFEIPRADVQECDRGSCATIIKNTNNLNQ